MDILLFTQKVVNKLVSKKNFIWQVVPVNTILKKRIGTNGIAAADFIAKLQISLKETAETEYWLRLLMLSEYITQKEGESLLIDCLEIKRILISTLNTAKENK